MRGLGRGAAPRCNNFILVQLMELFKLEKENYGNFMGLHKTKGE